MQDFINTRNPILPLEYHVPDSEGHVMSDGKLYIYGSFDDQEDAWCSEKYHVVSTADMENWTIHDISLNGKDIPWFNNPNAPKYPGLDWSKPTPYMQKMLEDDPSLKAAPEKQDRGEIPSLLYAPDCIEHNGKYYLYFCMADESEGVAVSDKPEGPFTNPVQLPCGEIDPAIFIDDDGQAYYYWGQFASHGVKMNADMVSFNRDDVVDNLVTEEEHFFHEGSSMRKIGDTYYYVYADMERGRPTALGYSTSKSPLGPFTYQGIIIDNAGCDPASWNNHGSIECVNGQWYVFYHRCSRNTQRHRRLCIEKIVINPDGTIDEVKMTSQGAGAPFAPGEKICGYQACGVKGTVYIGLDAVYGEKLMNISGGDEAVFRYVKSDADFSGIELTCAGSGKVQISMSGKACGTVYIFGEAGKVQKASAQIQAPAGEHELVLDFPESDSLEIMEIVLK